MTNQALCRELQRSSTTFPLLSYHAASEFGMTVFGEPDYRELKKQFDADGKGNWVLMPPYPYSPNESLFDAARSRRPIRHHASICSAPTTAGATSSCASRTASTSH